MEFHEKLQELRKSRSMTQEELAQALLVSRTAISKWETGKGYPSIDSLKEISRFFSVRIDTLICADEILTAADQDKKALAGKTLSLVCSALDILSGLLLFLPAFGNGAESPATVPLHAITGLQPWLRTLYAGILCAMVLCGVLTALLSGGGRPVLSRRGLLCGIALSVLSVCVFILSRQPYAGIVCFSLLVIKGLAVRSVKQP